MRKHNFPRVFTLLQNSDTIHSIYRVPVRISKIDDSVLTQYTPAALRVEGEVHRNIRSGRVSTGEGGGTEEGPREERRFKDHPSSGAPRERGPSSPLRPVRFGILSIRRLLQEVPTTAQRHKATQPV